VCFPDQRPSPTLGRGHGHPRSRRRERREVPHRSAKLRGQAAGGLSHRAILNLQESLVLRSIPQNGDVKAAMAAVQKVKVYPLADPGKAIQYTDVTGKDIAGTSAPWEDNIEFWRKLHEVLDDEPVLSDFRAMYGVLSQLGLEKGKPFVPDAR